MKSSMATEAEAASMMSNGSRYLNREVGNHERNIGEWGGLVRASILMLLKRWHRPIMKKPNPGAT